MSFSRPALLSYFVVVACLLIHPADTVTGEDKGSVPPVVPLRQAHAHNDYEHKRPLQDALEHGFCSIEADVFLSNGKLLVAHTPFQLDPEKTLEALYLDPLRKRAKLNGGRVYPKGPTIFLLIDVKTDAKETYAALAKVLPRYDDILSVTRKNRFEARAVTVVISGNRDRDAIAAQEVRYAGIDGRFADLGSDVPAHLMPWVSERWSAIFHWQGEGLMPDEERVKLREFVAKAHKHGRLVRFWGTPEKPTVWTELFAADVDLINTDQLADLRQFLLPRLPKNPRP
jgi:hypothetical protein